MRPINRNYVKKISDAYIEFFYYYTASPLLIVNTDDFDLSNSESDFDLLLEQISNVSPGKHYFNPKES